MNFFRGTGIKGLRGIQPKKDKIIRPLLFAKRKEIEDFAGESGLSFVLDATNDESAFTRNFFRNHILPDVNKHYPEAGNNILNNIKRFSDTELLYEQAIAIHKKNLLEAKGNEVHIPVLKLKRSNPLHTIVHEIISAFGFKAHQAAAVIKLLDSETGKYISSATHRIIKNRNWLIISPVNTTEAGNIMIEAGDKEISFALGKLRIETTILRQAQDYKPQTTNNIALLDAKEIEFPLLLRKWKSSDYFYPLGMKKKKKLNRFFIDCKLSKTEKENAWVIESRRRIIWVVGHRIDERCKVTEQTSTILKIEWEPA